MVHNYGIIPLGKRTIKRQARLDLDIGLLCREPQVNMKSLGDSRRRADKALRVIVTENGQFGTPKKGGSRKVAVEALGIKGLRGVLSLPTRERGLKQLMESDRSS